MSNLKQSHTTNGLTFKLYKHVEPAQYNMGIMLPKRTSYRYESIRLEGKFKGIKYVYYACLNNDLEYSENRFKLNNYSVVFDNLSELKVFILSQESILNKLFKTPRNLITETSIYKLYLNKNKDVSKFNISKLNDEQAYDLVERLIDNGVTSIAEYREIMYETIYFIMKKFDLCMGDLIDLYIKNECKRG